MKQHPLRGFSLLELLVSMAVIGLLAALAWPGFHQLLQRSLRQDGRLALLRIQHLQERHFSEHLAYAPSLANVTRSAAGYYRLNVTIAAGGNSYTAIATVDPLQRQSTDLVCAYLSVDETGRRRSADASGSWRDEDTERCWG